MDSYGALASIFRYYRSNLVQINNDDPFSGTTEVKPLGSDTLIWVATDELFPATTAGLKKSKAASISA
jgi:hypothetical protein